MNELVKYRTKIEEIDKEMAELFEQRMNIAKKIALYKKANKLPLVDADREKALINKNLAYLTDEQLHLPYTAFLKKIMNISKDYQNIFLDDLMIGYQGIEGAFSWLATKNLYPNATLINFQTFEEVFRAVSLQTIQYGILPIENSYTGEIGDILDLLFKYDIHIIGTYEQEIKQSLLALPSTTLEKIETVISHPQALMQCADFIKSKNFETRSCLGTSISAEMVAKLNDESLGAICNSENAQIYNLQVLVENINSSSVNTTRFIIISKKPQNTGNHASLIFRAPHESGSLVNVLNIISKYGFNMEKIQSHSLKDIPWEYFFYIELSIDNNDNFNTLIKELKEKTITLKNLGIFSKYPK